MRAARQVFSRSELKNFGLWVKAGPLDDVKAGVWLLDLGINWKAQGEGTNSAGGYLVPTIWEEKFDSLLDRFGTYRRYVRYSRMTSDSKAIPRRVGAATVYFPAEAGIITESDLSWDSISLTAHKMAAVFRVSSELNEDSLADFGAEVADEAARAMAQREDEIAFAGDGGGNAMGVSGIATQLEAGGMAGAVAAGSGHDTFAEVDAADLAAVEAALPERADDGAAWYCSKKARSLVFSRLAASGGGLQIISGEPCYSCYPIRVTAALPKVATTLANKAMLLFGNLEMASVLGDRRQFAFDTSNLGTSFAEDQILMRATSRLDINNHDLGDATNPGAMVALIGTS